jgi:hypothetical protein
MSMVPGVHYHFNCQVKKFKTTERGTKDMAPLVGSQPLPRWARGPLLAPYRPGTPTYKLQVKIGTRACTQLPPCVLQNRTLLASQGGLQGYHVYSGPKARLPNRKGSDAATCTMASDPTSLQGRALMHRVSYGSRSCLRSLRALVCHASCSSLWATGPKHKEKPSRPSYEARLSCSRCTCACFQGS